MRSTAISGVPIDRSPRLPTATEAQSAHPGAEVAQLKGCIHNLTSVQALPFHWTGIEPSKIVGMLLEFLVRMLRLEFAYARDNGFAGSAPVETVRCTRRQQRQIEPRVVAEALEGRTIGELTTSCPVIQNPIGGGEVRMATIRFKSEAGAGILVAAARRTDFPTEIEMLLLRAATNKATIVLQESQLLRGQRRAAEELERRVFERTFELSAANEALRKEIVERRRAEEALAKAHEELARAARVMSMGELTASIAHEVNQPLAAIVANANASLRWLAAEPSNPGEVRSAVERVIDDAKRASEVIAQTRAFLRREKSSPSRLQVDDIIGEVIGMAQDQAQRYGVSLRENSERDVPAVEADHVQLQQVLLNLVMNAIEAMRMVNDRARNLVVSVKRQVPDAVLVSVRDSGIGLDPQDLERIFDAFYTTKPDGIGMGLAISRSIVEAHGGHLWPTANEDFGETFHFTLPVAAASCA